MIERVQSICLEDSPSSKKEEAKLDKEAAALPAEEQPAKPTKFETDKEKLRQAIRTALDVYKRQILS